MLQGVIHFGFGEAENFQNPGCEDLFPGVHPCDPGDYRFLQHPRHFSGDSRHEE